jgi:hypothetical protein
VQNAAHRANDFFAFHERLAGELVDKAKHGVAEITLGRRVAWPDSLSRSITSSLPANPAAYGDASLLPNRRRKVGGILWPTDLQPFS